MKAGYFIGLTRSAVGDRIVMNTEYLMMEEMMQQFKIEAGEDISPAYQDKEFAEGVKKEIIKSLMIALHGSDDPKVVTAARNTSLFGFHGPAFGDLGGKLPKEFKLLSAINWPVQKVGEGKKFTWLTKEQMQEYLDLWEDDIVPDSIDWNELSFRAYDF